MFFFVFKELLAGNPKLTYIIFLKETFKVAGKANGY